MDNQEYGYHGVLLEVELSNRQVNHLPLSSGDAVNFVGGRGLGIKILWDRLKKPGVSALSPENPLMFLKDQSLVCFESISCLSIRVAEIR